MHNDDVDTSHTLAAEIAEYLEGWTVPERDDSKRYWGQLVGPEGETIYVHTGSTWSKPGQVNLSATLPDGYGDVQRYDERRTDEINVSISRGAEVIAREITRRLLPGYLEAHADMRERIAKRAAEKAHTAKVTSDLAAAFKGSTSEYDGPEKFRFGHVNRSYYGDVRMNYNAESCTLEIHSLPTDLAREIAKTMARYDAKQQRS